jgi:hypothetical protein
MRNCLIGVLAACAVFLVRPPAFAASVEELAGAERAASLNAGEGPIIAVQLKNPAPVLMPRHDEVRRLVAETMASLGPTLFVEALSLYKKPAGTNSGRWSAAEQTRLFNQIVSLSTLAGIEYYSASRRTMRIFYESSQVIDGPETKNAVPDPVYAAPPPALTLYARQKDLSFGENIYRYDYRCGDDGIFFVQDNLTVMNYSIFPVAGKNKFRTVMAVIDAGDSLVVYAAAMAKAASVPGLGDRIGNSFNNRAAAMLSWFSGRADAAFRRHG